MRLIASLMRGAAATWPADLDGAKFLRDCDAHGATPLIAWQLRRNPELRLPADVVAQLEASARAMTTLDVVRRHAVDELLERFASARIPLLVIKGAALARTHYPHSSLRPRCDIDVFVEPPSVPRVIEVLRAAGFQEESGSGGELISHQRIWMRIDAVGVRHCVDLHWALSNRQRYVDTFSFDELWSRGVMLRGDVRMPSPADALLIAAMHLDGHHRGNERLIWLYDIHLLHGTIAPQELQAAALLARDRNLDLPLDVAIALALRWFGDGHAGDAVAPAAASEIEVLVDDLRFTPGLRGKMRLMREHLFPPAAYVMEKYGAQSRAALPALYLRRAAAWLLRH